MMKSRHLHYPGLVLFALALPATAEVIYSNLQDIAIPATYDGVYLNVETGAWNTDMFNPVAGWDINPYFGGSVLWNSPSFQPVRSGTGEMDSVLNLGSGTIVDAASVISTFVQGPSGDNPGGPGYGGSETHLDVGPGQFAAGDEGFLGFKLNGTNYGWMRVVFTDNAGGALIKDWAYDNNGGAIATGNVIQNGSTVTLDSTFGSFTLGSQLTGSVGVVKTGSGTTTLVANNDYTGTTAIDQGTLLINGSTSSTSLVTVASGATLGGNGTVGAATTVSGFLKPGNSAGELNFGSSLTLETGSSTTMEILGLNRGADYDGIDVGGALTYGGALTLDLGSLFGAGTYNFNLFNFVIGDDSGDFASVTLAGLYGGSLVNDGFGVWGLTDGNDNIWTFTQSTGDLGLVVIPEPAAALLGGLGLLMLLRRRR